MNRDEIKGIVRSVVQELLEDKVIPIGISNRHIHLSQADFDVLFPGQQMEKKKDLMQKGEFACEQLVTLIGPKGKLTKVRLLGPARKATQVELAMTDARILGLPVPLALSGDLSKAAMITIQSEAATLTIPAAIIAKRHIHMSPEDAKKFGVTNGEIVKVEVKTDGRTTIFGDVVIRENNLGVLEMHLDTDEANAAAVGPQTVGRIVK